MYKPCFLTIIFILLFFGSACKKEKEKQPVVDQGIISYRITYTPQIMERSFSFLLPDEMTYYFSPGHERISFKGNMGLYKLEFISNQISDSSTTLLKILNNKMYVPPSESEKLFIFNNLNKGEVVFHKDTTQEILGYEALNATIRIDSPNKSDINVWYTPRISSGTTNKNTPFSDVPGVMLRFAILYNDILFTLEAKSIEKKEHSESVFEVPNDYKTTSLHEIEKMILGIIN